MTVPTLNWMRLGKGPAITLVSMLCCLLSNAQQWELQNSRTLDLPVKMLSSDRFNNIYINDSKENIVKIDSLGRSLALFAPQQFGKLTTLEPWAALRVFLFYEDTQKYGFLDRFLAESEFSEFPREKFGFVKIAAPSSDNQIWLLDIRSMSLAKFDITFNAITLKQSLNQLSDTLDLNPYQLIEYQNRVYLGDSQIGVMVFDNLGNYLRTLRKSGSSQFHFYQEQLYYLEEGQLHFLSIYSDHRQSVGLPKSESEYQHVIILENSTVLVASNKLLIFRYTPR